MEFMRLAMEFGIHNLEEIKKGAAQYFFVQKNIALHPS